MSFRGVAIKCCASEQQAFTGRVVAFLSFCQQIQPSPLSFFLNSGFFEVIPNLYGNPDKP